LRFYQKHKLGLIYPGENVMNNVDELVQEREDLKLRVTTLVSLLKEARESVHAAIGLELEYADYPSAERLRSLKMKIEEEIVKNERVI